MDETTLITLAEREAERDERRVAALERQITLHATSVALQKARDREATEHNAEVLALFARQVAALEAIAAALAQRSTP